MKLHIKNTLQAESDKILDALKRVLGIEDCEIHQDCNCYERIEIFIWRCCEHEYYEAFRNNVCLYAYGRVSESNLNRLAILRFIGDGTCPECGSNDVKEHCEHSEAVKCNICGEEWLPDRYENTFN